MNQETNSIKIREASFADAEFIIEANLSMAKEIEGIELEREILAKGVKAVFRDPAKGHYIIGELNGEVAGCLLVTLEWSDWRNKQSAWIQSLFVKKEHREKGIFKAMFARLEEKVESGQYAGLRLYVESSNESAKEVYNSLGMCGDHYELFEKMGC